MGAMASPARFLLAFFSTRAEVAAEVLVESSVVCRSSGNTSGGKVKRKFDCTLNFYIGSNFLLGSAGQKAMLSELNRILNDAGVGVNVVGSPTATG